MSKRLDYTQIAPAGVKALGGVYGYVMQSGLLATLVDLVYLQVSQINNCAYCLDMHIRDLLKKGQKVEKLALRQGEDQDAPRRADLLAQIRDARERRDEARRDYAGRVIDRADWLDIRQRTEDEISAARRYMTGSRGRPRCWATSCRRSGSGMRGNRGAPDRRRAAIRAVLVRVLIKPLPAGANANVAGDGKNTALRRERELAVLRRRVDFDWRV